MKLTRMWRFASLFLVMACAIACLMIPMEYYPIEIRRFFYLNKWSDELAHFTLFSSAMIFIPLWLKANKRSAAILLLILCPVTEMSQTLTGRSASIDDLMMNTLGVLAGYLILSVIRWKRAQSDHVVT